MGLLDGSIKVVNPATSQIINNLANEETGADSQPVTCIRTKSSHDSSHIIGAAYASGVVRTWNHDTAEIQSTFRDKGEALCLSFNPHINILAVGKGNGEIKLYDEASQKVASILTKSKNPNLCDGHTNKVFSIVNHPTNPQEVFIIFSCLPGHINDCFSFSQAAGTGISRCGTPGSRTVSGGSPVPS